MLGVQKPEMMLTGLFLVFDIPFQFFHPDTGHVVALLPVGNCNL
jgi:hypothetical protein